MHAKKEKRVITRGVILFRINATINSMSPAPIATLNHLGGLRRESGCWESSDSQSKEGKKKLYPTFLTF